jgi:hypothetical protein
MTLKNLEQRYNEKVNQLYRGATTKFENGRPGGGTNADPLNPRRVGDESFGRISQSFGRFLPIARATQDTIRLTKFLVSVRGLIFLGKQQLLQTGNTFEMTRLLNPAFVLGAAALPGVGNTVRIRRHLRPFATLLSKTDTSTPNVKKLGQLQVTTYNKEFLTSSARRFNFRDFIPPSPFSIPKQNIGEGNPWDKTRPELINYVKTIHGIPSEIKFKYGGTIVNTRNGLAGDTYDGNTYGITSNTGDPANAGRLYTTYYRGSNGSPGWARSIATRLDYGRLLIRSTATVTSRNKKITNILDAPTNPDIVRSDIISEVGNASALKNYATSADLETQIETYAAGLPVSSSRPSYLQYNRDQSNRAVTGRRASLRILDAYADLPTIETQADDKVIPAFDDPIIVSFAMGKDDHVQFRAFIKDLKQDATPEYKPYQYIGRIEKFISYVTVQRNVSFKLHVVAFSKDELPIVWKRINYLTGMVYPYGINRGILRPNIIRMTIGRVFVNQPGYITSINTTFDEVVESWDIDNQVPIGATLDMRFSLIEKRTALASTPLFGITQNVGGFATSLTEEPTSEPRG